MTHSERERPDVVLDGRMTDCSSVSMMLTREEEREKRKKGAKVKKYSH